MTATFTLQQITYERQYPKSLSIYAVWAAWVVGRHVAQGTLSRAHATSQGPYGSGASAQCLNENWFFDLADARRKIAEWKWDYNHVRPHSALNYQTPMEFAAAWKESFYMAGAGEVASKRRPLPPQPHPRYAAVRSNRRKSHYPCTKNGGQVKSTKMA